MICSSDLMRRTASRRASAGFCVSALRTVVVDGGQSWRVFILGWLTLSANDGPSTCAKKLPA